MKDCASPLYSALIIKDFCPSGNTYRLAGPHNADIRQQFASQLQGRKVPKASSGCNALEAMIDDSLGIKFTYPYTPGCQVYGCTANVEEFRKWLLDGIN